MRQLRRKHTQKKKGLAFSLLHKMMLHVEQDLKVQSFIDLKKDSDNICSKLQVLKYQKSTNTHAPLQNTIRQYKSTLPIQLQKNN